VRPAQKNAARVIGIGNLHRGDDGVGLLVARQLKTQPPANTVILEANGEGASLIEAWQGASVVILVDAFQSGGEAGTIHRLDAGQRPIPSRFFHYSTHAFSVAEAIELARALKQLPPRLIVFGVEGNTFQAGGGLSRAVKTAASRVILQIRKELDALREGARSQTASSRI
jgi:hydrogenase maturation protease